MDAHNAVSTAHDTCCLCACAINRSGRTPAYMHAVQRRMPCRRGDTSAARTAPTPVCAPRWGFLTPVPRRPQAYPAVPVIDLSLPEEEAARLVKEACSTVGFFYGQSALVAVAHSSRHLLSTGRPGPQPPAHHGIACTHLGTKRTT